MPTASNAAHARYWGPNSYYIKHRIPGAFFVAVACIYGLFEMLSENVGELAYYLAVFSGFGL